MKHYKFLGLLRSPPYLPANWSELQRALDEYRRFYNTGRLHQALGCRTPLVVVKSERVKGVSFS